MIPTNRYSPGQAILTASTSATRRGSERIESTASASPTPLQKRNCRLPKPGDLIYGVNSEFGRKGYLRRNALFAGVVHTLDQYPILKYDAKNGQIPADHSSFQAFIEAHPKYASILTADPDNDDLENENLRRKCKAGLEWALLAGKKVHFVLDDMDLDAVILKNFKGKNSDSKPGAKIKNRSITGSELRWIYRNRNRAAVKENLIFWSQGKPVPAPWDSDTVVVEQSKYRFRQEIAPYACTQWLAYKATQQA